MAVKWCAQLKEMCAVPPSCAVGVYHLVVWSPRPDQRSPFKAFAEDVKRNKHPLSVCLRAQPQFANQQLLLLLWWFLQTHDRSEHSLGVRWSVCFTSYFPFWKWGLSLCPVVLLSPRVAIYGACFPTLNLVLFSQATWNFRNGPFSLKSVSRREDKKAVKVFRAVVQEESFSQFTLPSC